MYAAELDMCPQQETDSAKLAWLAVTVRTQLAGRPLLYDNVSLGYIQVIRCFCVAVDAHLGAGPSSCFPLLTLPVVTAIMSGPMSMPLNTSRGALGNWTSVKLAVCSILLAAVPPIKVA